MKTKHMLQAAAAAGLLVLGFGLLQKAYAGVGTPDAMTISVSASGTGWGVQITSGSAGPGAGYQFGSVPIGQTTLSTTAVNVANVGSVSEYVIMTVASIGGDSWTANTAHAVTAYDTYELLGHLVAHNAARPTFDNAKDIISANVPSDGNTLYGQSSMIEPGAALSDNSKDLWMQFDMPQSVKTSNTQTFSLTITGQGT